MSNKPASEDDLESLENRVKALESLVIDLLAITHATAPRELAARLEATPLRISGSMLKPLLATATRRRNLLIQGAGVPAG